MLDQPQQEQIELENIKNQITLSEGELSRLRALRVSQEYTISELVKEKIWHSEELDRIRTEKETLEEDITKLQREIKIAHDIIESSTKVKEEFDRERRDLSKEKEEYQTLVNNKSQELARRESIVSTKEKNHLLEIEKLDKQKANISFKEAKITEFVKNLQVQSAQDKPGLMEGSDVTA